MERKCSLNQLLVEIPTANAGKPVTIRRLEALKELECPICYETIFRPVKDCKNGHHICKICLEKVSVCPLCKEPAGITQNRFAEDFLSRYIAQCSNYEAGCKIFFWMEEQEKLKEHELNCKYRKLQCWVPNCKIVTFNKFLSEHWANAHKITRTGRDEVTHVLLLDSNTEKYSANSFLLERDGHLFLAIFERVNSSVLFYFYGYCPTDLLYFYETSVVLRVEMQDCFGRFMYLDIHSWNGPICHKTESPTEIRKNGRDFFDKLPEVSKGQGTRVKCHVTIGVIPRRCYGRSAAIPIKMASSEFSPYNATPPAS